MHCSNGLLAAAQRASTLFKPLSKSPTWIPRIIDAAAAAASSVDGDGFRREAMLRGERRRRGQSPIPNRRRSRRHSLRRRRTHAADARREARSRHRLETFT